MNDPTSQKYVEAVPDAVWTRADPFRTYRPAGSTPARGPRPAHQTFSTLADNVFVKDKKHLDRMIVLYAKTYGLLGLFQEEFSEALLPERELDWMVFVAPDTVIDDRGKLHAIDPATDGKQLLEEAIFEHDRQVLAESDQLYLLKQIDLDSRRLILPSELRFQKLAASSALLGTSRRLFDPDGARRTFTYEDVRRRYGVRALFDRSSPIGTSLISTREPVKAWRRELFSFAQPPTRSRLNRALKDVNPRAATDKGNKPASSWSCPSLLKAIYLMRYLDLVAGTRMQRCQAPGCHEYFRVGPRSRESLYCPPPPGRKQSKCASRASSQMYRERQRKRRKSDTN